MEKEKVMEKDLKKIETKDLIEMYKKIQDFIAFLDKEYKNTEKMRDAND